MGYGDADIAAFSYLTKLAVDHVGPGERHLTDATNPDDVGMWESDTWYMDDWAEERIVREAREWAATQSPNILDTWTNDQILSEANSLYEAFIIWVWTMDDIEFFYRNDLGWSESDVSAMMELTAISAAAVIEDW